MHGGTFLNHMPNAIYPTSSLLAARKCANSDAGVMNEEEPQSRQTLTLGNTKTPTLSAFPR